MTSDLRSRLEDALRGRYRVEDEVGQGGMAVVFRATDLKHGRVVAIKVLRPELLPDAGGERFDREIQIAASLNHPRILPLHDSGTHEGLRYYVMPFVVGESVRQRLDTAGAIDPLEALRLIGDIAAGLHYAHERGLIHRDIKPENILLASGEAVVTDFGIARPMDPGAPRLTGTSVLVGTPDYMSPEQAAGSNDLDGRSDVYSLACVLYEMLAGRPPFQGLTLRRTLAAHVIDPVPDLAELRADLPAGLAAVVHRALAKDPDARYPTAGAFAAALDQVRAGLGSRLVPALAADRRGRRRWIGWGLVATLAGVLYLAWPSRGSFQPPPVSRARLAILPFATEGPADDPYFADGLTDELTARLSRLPTLSVVARNAVFRPGERPFLPDVGRRLGVDYVLSGIIRWTGLPKARRMRVFTTLIRVADSTHAGGGAFESTPEDLFTLQSQIAQQTVEDLPLRLAMADADLLKQGATQDVEAYRLYTLGRFAWKQRTPEGLVQAADYFSRAIARDSAFARAWSGLADAYVLFSQFGVTALPRDRADERASTAANRALALDAKLPEPYASLGEVAMYRDWNWAEAERRFQQAVARDSAYATARQWYAELLLLMGRYDEAVEQARHAVAADPVSAEALNALAVSLLSARRWNEALGYYRQALEVDPRSRYAILGTLWTHLAMGKADDALALYQRMGDTSAVTRAWVRGVTEAARRPAARAMLHQHPEWIAQQPSLLQATAWAAVGAADEAFDVLERMVRTREFFPGLKNIPLYDPIRSDPRFAALVREMGLPP